MDSNAAMLKPTAQARPRAKLAAITAAAWRLFLDQGFGGTSMDAIAQAAGVSKATLYAYFSSKEDMFTQVVAAEGERHSRALGDHGDTGCIASTLMRTAIDFSGLFLSADNMSVMRMIMSELPSFPELGAKFFLAGPNVLIDRLAARMAAAMRKGEMTEAPPRLAAAQFMSLILGELQLQALLGVGKPASKRTRNTVAIAGAQAFMRAYGIAQTTPGRAF